MRTEIASRLQSLWARLLRLKGPLAAIAAGGALLGGLAGYWNAYHAARQAVGGPVEATSSAKTTIPADAGPLSILVLPFANQTGDANKAYIADALTSSISADLNRIRDAFVVPTATAFTYKDKNLTVAQVGKDAGVRFVLQGGVVASGDKLRISAQLADTQSGKQLWNETFEGDTSKLFELQDLVTARIGNSIGNEMVIVAARESEKRKSSPKVADLMMRQRALALKPPSIEVFNQRESLLRSVIKQEPENTDAMAALGATLAGFAWNFLDDSIPLRRTMFTEAKALALRAKATDDKNPSIYTTLRLHAAAVDKDRSEWRRAIETAIKLNPKSPAAYNSLAVWYYYDGQPHKAIEQLIKALELYPKGSDIIFLNMACNYLALGDNAVSIEWSQRAVDAGGQHVNNFSNLAMAHANLGHVERAAHFSNEYKQRSLKAGSTGRIEKLDGGESPAWIKYYNEHYLPEWRKAGLPE